MIPDEGEGMIMFKGGKYVAFKFDLASWPHFKRAIEQGKKALKVPDGQTRRNPTK